MNRLSSQHIARWLLAMLLAFASLFPALAMATDFGEICGTPRGGGSTPGVGQMLPGRYYSPDRSGQGWDFFWYGNTLEAGSSASNDKLFVTFYTYEQRGGQWSPAWYGATYDPAHPGDGLGFTTAVVNGVTVRTKWTGIFYRYNQVSFAGGYGPIRQADPGTSTPAAQAIGTVTVYFGADGVSNGQRPDRAAVEWSLADSDLHPASPGVIEDCLQNVVTGNETEPSANAAYVGVWAPEFTSAGWFWTPIFWNFDGTENEHHVLAFFDEDGAPSWIVAGANAQACFFTVDSYGTPVGDYPTDGSLCVTRPKGYAPWETVCDQTPCWNAAQYMFRVGKMARGDWSTLSTGQNRTVLRVTLEKSLHNTSNPVLQAADEAPLSVALNEGSSTPLPPFDNVPATVSQIAGFTRIRVDDVNVAGSETTAPCLVTTTGTSAKAGLCNLRVHFMTEGAHPGMVIVRRRVAGGGRPDDMKVISTGLMRSPMLGLPFPVNNNIPANAIPGDTESLIAGDAFYFQAFPNLASATQLPTPNPLFSTVLMTARPRTCSAGDALIPVSPSHAAPLLQIEPATVNGQVFRITAPLETGARIVQGVRLRVYLNNTNVATNTLFAEKLVLLSLNGAALDQTITIPGLIPGQKYSAVAELFNHCTVKQTASVTLQLPVVTLTYPGSDLSLTANTPVTLTATVTDDGTVNASSVKFVLVKAGLTQELATTASGSTYSASWTPAVGVYSITAKGSDTLGLSAVSTPARIVTVTAPPPVSVTRTYVYDEHQRLCKTIDPEAGATVYDYDDAGNVLWTAEGRNLTNTAQCNRDSVTTGQITRSYDELNRLTRIDYPDTTSPVTTTANIVNTYYPDGALHTVTSAGNVWTYGYNNRRLMTSESLQIDSKTFAFDYAYNANGHLDTMTYPDAATIAYAPNALGQPTQAGSYATGIAYYPNGSIHQMTYGNGIVHTMDQNARQLPQRARAELDTGAEKLTKILDDTYTYDRNGNVTDIIDQAETGTTTRGMSYDGNNRLRVAVAPGLWGTASYTYDALDNLRTADQGARAYRYVYDAQNRVTQISNAAGVSQITLGYNAKGDVTSKNAATYTFDTAHRLLSVPGKADYVYDGHGRRVKETKAESKKGSEYGVYGSSGQKLYRSTSTATTRYIHLAGSQIAAVDVVSGTPSLPTYTHTDGLGSVVATTSSTGAVLNRYRYAPYGESLNLAFGTVMDGLGYTGHDMDADTGLTYMQQRYYEPVIGRFLNVDPVTANAGVGFNRYSYAAGNPYRFKDPDGRECKSADGTTNCDPGKKGEGLPTITFPTPKEFPKSIGGGLTDHEYRYETDSGSKTDKSVQQSIANDPTPGKDNPATPNGTRNNASPVTGPRKGLSEAGISSPVKSYTATDDKGNVWTINVTEPGHPLHPGYVLRGAVAGKTISYGEGSGILQALGPTSQLFINDVWKAQNQENIDNAK